jgi:gluconate 2-dehydrogenase gamma chain
MVRRVSRREMIRRAAVVGAVTALPGYAAAQARDPEPFVNLTETAGRTLEAVVARLIPSDANGPGALEAGAARYIDRALGDALAGARAAYLAGFDALNAYARKAAGATFADLDAERQDAVLGDVERNVATGFVPSAAAFFDMVLGHTLEGTFSDPHYGGNRDFVGWQLIGYPGLRLAVTPELQRMNASPALTRISAYDLPMFDAGEENDDGR